MDKKNFYGLFVGQNASYGSPNEQTGRMSFYGNVLRFDSIETRQHYIDTHQFDINDQIIKPGGRHVMRDYCLGMSMYNFNEYLDYLDNITMADLET